MHEKDCECCSKGPEALDGSLAEMIEEYGFAIVSSVAEINGKAVSLSYTVGLADTGNPEIVVFGLPAEVAHTLLNHAGSMLLAKTLTPNAMHDELGNLPLVFKPVTSGVAGDFITFANRRAGGLQPALQMVWPDANGVFPWGDGFQKKFEGIQPPLYTASH